jgi:polar amino acid transport system substrate-binding protein
MFVRTILAALALGIAATAAPAQTLDLSPEQPGRPRAERDEAAIRLISENARLAKNGVLTVALTATQLPFGAYATDTRTVVGSEPDIAQLVADSLGLKLELVPVAWADWPLGLASGKYDAVISNVTVTEQRKEKFDFSTYRKDQLGFYAKTDSAISIREPKDVAGLRVIVGASTNQEQILLRWNQQNVAQGLKPVEVQYYDDDVVRGLAIQSGRADVYLGPNAIAAFEAARSGTTKLVGTFSGGWPLVAEIAVTTRKGGGLADAVTHAINTQIKNGNYAKALARWNLTPEAIEQSHTNPPGLPKS